MTHLRTRGVVRFLALVLVLGTLAGCGGGGGSTGGQATSEASQAAANPSPSPSPTPTPTGTVVVQHTLLPRGVPSTVTDFRFTGRDSAGEVVYGPEVRPRAATVTLTGVPTPTVTLLIEYLQGDTVLGLYLAPVTVTEGGTATVSDPPFTTPITSLQVTPPLPVRAQGTTVQFTARATFTDGTTQDVTGLASWSSADPGVATVSDADGSRGLATCVAAGSTTVTATLDGVGGSASLAVTAAALVSLQVSPAAASIADGTTAQFSATGTFSDGTSQDVTTQVNWTTAEAGVATVAGTGRATAVDPGQTTVTATALGGVSATADLFVTGATLAALEVTPASSTIASGTTQAFKATGTFTDGSTQDLTSLAAWTADSPGVVTVSGGVATGVAPGTAGISADVGGVSGEATLTVTEAVLLAIEVAPSTPIAARGTSVQFAATGTFSDGTTQDLTTTANWTSADVAVATVAAGGLATGVDPGQTAIKASMGAVQGGATLTVVGSLLQVIEVAPADQTLLACGLTWQYTATGRFIDGTSQDLTATAVWASSSTAVATVDGTGLATTVDPGTTTISATVSGVAGSATLAVERSETPLLTAPPGYKAGSTPVRTVSADFDGANGPDLAVAAVSSDQVKVLLNQGDGTFAEATGYAVGDAPFVVAAGDFDGVNGPDLVAANAQDETLSVLLNNGDGTFAGQAVYPLDSNPSSIAVADFDGVDGPDLAVGFAGLSRVFVFLNSGDGTFGDPVLYSPNLNSTGVAAGDLDGVDGTDLVSVDADFDKVGILFNQGDGTLASGVKYPVGSNPVSVAVGDLDGLNGPDLVTANHDAGTVSVLLDSGGGAYSAAVSYAAGPEPLGVALGDLDGDGMADLAVTSADDTVAVLLNAGDGTFGTPTIRATVEGVAYSGQSRPNEPVVEDFDEDGTADLAVVGTTSGVGVLLNQGGGDLGYDPVVAAGDGSASVAAADLDEDGDPDLATANRRADTVSVLLRNADGSYAAAVAYPVGDFPGEVAVADLDGVNGPDLVTANTNSKSVSVLLNSGDGTYAAAVSYSVSQKAASLAIADYDGVNGLDVAVAGWAGNLAGNPPGVTVLLNQGDGTLATGSTFGNLFSGQIRTADLDGVQGPDLVVTADDTNTDRLQVFLNDGDGTFGSATQVAALAGSIGVGDLDGVNGPDLVVNDGDSALAVFLNDGDGTFGSKISSTGEAAGEGTLTLGDLNCDGQLDIVRTAGFTQAWMNLGGGSFEARAVYGVGGNGALLDDLDGDGFLDLVLGLLDADGVTLLHDSL